MALEIFSQLLFGISTIIFEKVEKLVWTKHGRKFSMSMFVHFGLLESISAEPKANGHDQNFVVLQNMGLDRSRLFLCKSTEGLF